MPDDTATTGGGEPVDPAIRLLPCGDRAVLVELADAAARRAFDAALRATPLPGVLEHVPAARTVLVTVASPSNLPDVVARLRRVRPVADLPDPDTGHTDPLLEIPVRYDGADLDEVARHLGCSAREVVARHTGQAWRVEFAGFAPGFGYLLGDEGGLEVPRRETPRTRIPPGAVGLAGPWSGVYPRASPGGWQILGRTDLPMWDDAREPPALLTPGRVVHFVEVTG